MDGLKAKALDVLSSLSSSFQDAKAGAASGSISHSWMIVFLPIVVVMLVGITVGKSRAVVTLISLYITALLVRLFPFGDLIHKLFKKTDPAWINGALLAVLFIAVFVLLNHSFLPKRLSTEAAPILSVLGLTLLEVGFLISIAFSLDVLTDSMPLYAQLYYLFATKIAQFVWAIVPMIGLIYIRREKRGSSSSSSRSYRSRVSE